MDHEFDRSVPAGGSARAGGGFYHLSFRSGSRAGGASARGAFDYATREGEYGDRDLDEALYTESDHMPSWARDDPEAYWDAADLWLAFIDAERRLHGFETFLGQYRALLSSVPSGVTYAAPAAWRGAIEAAFTRALATSGAHAMNLTTVLDYFTVRREVEANRFAAFSVAQLDRFRELRTQWATPALQALYERWRVREDGSLAGSEVAAAGAVRLRPTRARARPHL